jgi:hypothetical protein
MELWQILLGIAFLLAVLTFTYLLISRMKRRGLCPGVREIMGSSIANGEGGCSEETFGAQKS